jgi:hypothetical protein
MLVHYIVHHLIVYELFEAKYFSVLQFLIIDNTPVKALPVSLYIPVYVP